MIEIPKNKRENKFLNLDKKNVYLLNVTNTLHSNLINQ